MYTLHTPSEHLNLSWSKRQTVDKVSKNLNTHSSSDRRACCLKVCWISLRNAFGCNQTKFINHVISLITNQLDMA